MGWKARDWYLGPHRDALFDTAGNAGPTIWSDGRIVGGWAVLPSGEVVTRLLDDIGSEAVRAVSAEAARLTEWLRSTRVVPRFATPLARELVAAAPRRLTSAPLDIINVIVNYCRMTTSMHSAFEALADPTRRQVSRCPTVTTTAVELVVLSWNMQGRGPEELRLSAALQAWQPDVLLLQEANGDQVGEVLPPTFQSRLWWPTAGTPPGIVIASRFALEEQALVDPLDPVWDRPRAAWARLRLGVASLTVASVHLLAPLAPGRRPRRDSAIFDGTRCGLGWARLVATGRAPIVAGRLQHP